MRKVLAALTVAILVLGGVQTANATLWDRGGGFIYDDIQDLTFLQDANYVLTSGFVSLDGLYQNDGLLRIGESTMFVNNLVYGGVSGWRHPNATPCGYPPGSFQWTCTGSEVSFLYSNYGISTSNQGFFSNVQNFYFVYSPITPGASSVWVSSMADGQVHLSGDMILAGTWAVHDGDVAPIPEPSTLLLIGSGMTGLAYARRRVKARRQ